jgi:hypothetical protein
MATQIVLIDVGYACAGIVMEDGVCVEAAPIFKWMIGKRGREIKKWRKIRQWWVAPTG